MSLQISMPISDMLEESKDVSQHAQHSQQSTTHKSTWQDSLETPVETQWDAVSTTLEPFSQLEQFTAHTPQSTEEVKQHAHLQQQNSSTLAQSGALSWELHAMKPT